VKPLLTSALRSIVGARPLLEADQSGSGELRSKKTNPISTALGQSRHLLRQSARASDKKAPGVQDQLRQSTYIYDTVMGEFVGTPTSHCAMNLI
jgi:hypothetical protein